MEVKISEREKEEIIKLKNWKNENKKKEILKVKRMKK